jgi:peptide deformylase
MPRTILKMGNPLLSTPSESVKEFDKALLNIIQDMRDAMDAQQGIGIAAPQIGVPQRIILFGFEQNKRYPNVKSIPFTILVNPEIEILSTEMEDGWEACLSVPGLRGLVARYKKIKYQGYDQTGQLIVGEAQDWHARVIQHEFDHLNGVLYPQRIKDLRFFGFEDELNTRKQ